MSVEQPSAIDDELLIQAAERIIRQYQLREGSGSEDSSSAINKPTFSAPDNIQGLRLAVDDMSLAVQHLERLFTARETVFAAVLERIERNMASLAGRVDALVEDVVQITARPQLQVDAVLDETRASQVAIIAEFGSMMSLGRNALHETSAICNTTIAELNKLVDQIAGASERTVASG